MTNAEKRLRRHLLMELEVLFVRNPEWLRTLIETHPHKVGAAYHKLIDLLKRG